MNRFYSLLVLLFVGSAGLQAQSDPFPEFNFRLYQLNISLTAQVIQYGNVVEDALVAAFCGDEIRGKKNVGDGTQPDILYMPVYGDYKGEYQYLHFKVYTGGKVFTYHPEPALDWEDCYVDNNQMVGSTSNPYIIDITPVSLANDADNSATLTTWKDKTCDMVLTGRTLFKEGAWNTLCLPFSLSEEQIAASDLAGATIMELDATGTYDTDKQTGFDANDGTLYLYFKTAESIVAGKPYIIKWTSGNDLDKPVFTSVTMTSTEAGTVEARNSGLNPVQFIGTYSPAPLTPNDKSNLFLGEGSTLYYPNASNNADGKYYVNSCRAYFHVDLNGSAGIRAFVLNFGDDEETTGIVSMEDVRDEMSDEWFTLDGRKLQGRPTAKGLYVHGGRTVVIK